MRRGKRHPCSIKVLTHIDPLPAEFLSASAEFIANLLGRTPGPSGNFMQTRPGLNVCVELLGPTRSRAEHFSAGEYTWRSRDFTMQHPNFGL